MTEPKPTYLAAPPDAHLEDLLELKAIAAGTQTEAYVWPRLMKRLQEMIQQRLAVLCDDAAPAPEPPTEYGG